MMHFITVQSTFLLWFNVQLGSRNHFTSMSHKPLSATTCQISLPWIRRPHSFRRFSSPASPPWWWCPCRLPGPKAFPPISKSVLGRAVTWRRGCVNCFLRFPQLNCSCPAAQARKGKSQKIVNKPLIRVTALPSISIWSSEQSKFLTKRLHEYRINLHFSHHCDIQAIFKGEILISDVFSSPGSGSCVWIAAFCWFRIRIC